VVSSGVVFAILALLLAPRIAGRIFDDPRSSTVVVFFAAAIPFKLAADLLGSANQGVGRLYLKLLMVDLWPALCFSGALGLLFFMKAGSLDTVVAWYLLPMVLAPFLFPWKCGFPAIFQRLKTPVSYRELLGYSGPLLLSGVVAWPMTLVPVVIGSVTSVESVSYYSLSISIASFIYLGVSVTEAAGLSVWSSYLGTGDTKRLEEDYRLSTRWGLMVGSIVFIPLLLCPAEVVGLLFGSKFGLVTEILPVVSCIFFANLATGPTESILKAYGETRFIFAARLTVGIVIALTLYPFLKLWGLSGAIAAYGLSTVIAGISMYSGLLYKKYNLHPFDKYFLYAMMSILSSIALTGFFIRNISLPGGAVVRIAITAVVYGLLLVLQLGLLQAIAPRERLILARLMARCGVVIGGK